MIKQSLIILSFLFFACNSTNKPKQEGKPAKETLTANSTKTVLPKPVYACNILNNKAKLYRIADSILKVKNNPYIINLRELDSTSMVTFEDYFLYPDKKSRMVFFGGEAGMSSGSESSLLILLHCKNKKAKIIWVAQSNLYSKKNMKDLNGDGVKEIINRSGAAWMSSIREHFEIISFKNGKRKTLYSTLSNTQRDYFEEDWYMQGDTIAKTYKNKILDTKETGIIKIRQTKTVKLFNGGKSQEEAYKKCIVRKTTRIISIE